MYNPKSIVENETHKCFWDFEIQTERLISPKPNNSQQQKREPAE